MILSQLSLVVGLVALSTTVQGSLMWLSLGELLQPLSGETFKIFCHSSIPGAMLSWRLNNQTLTNAHNIEITPLPVPSGTQSGLTIKRFSQNETGILSCREELSNGSLVEITENITGESYSFNIVGTDTIIEGQNSTLSCLFAANNRTVTGYTWKGKNNDSQDYVVLPSTSHLLHILNSSLIFDIYSCSISVSPTNGEFTVTTSVAAYFIPQLIGDSTVDATVRAENNITINCSINGTGLKYTWLRQDSRPLPLSALITDDVLTLFNASYATAGVYTCTGSNIAGNTSQYHNITVEGPPQLLNASAALVHVTLTERDSITLPCPHVSVPAASVQWYNGSTLLMDDNDRVTLLSYGASISSVYFTDTGEYVCNVTNRYGSAKLSYNLSVYGIPPPPVDLAASNVTALSVSLSWLHASSSVMLRSDWFVIRINGTKVLNVSGDVTMVTVMGLTPGQYYEADVIASNRAGVSEPSSKRYFVTNKSAPRLSFFNVTALAGGRSLLLSWSLQYTGGSAIDLFIITISTNGVEVSQHNPDINNGRLIIDNLEPNTQYAVGVSINNLIGRTMESVDVTTVRGPPGKPTTPIITDTGMMHVTLQFSFPSIGSETINNYIVNISNPESGLVTVKVPVTRQPLLGENITVMVTSLSKGASYSFSISGESVIGRGEFSDYSATVTTEDSGSLLYYIIIPIATVFILVLLLLIISVCCLCVIKRRQHTKHTITRFNRRNMYTGNMFPSSSVCDKASQPIGSEADSPPQSALGHRDEALVIAHHHHRTQSVSSNASSHFTIQSRRGGGGGGGGGGGDLPPLFLSPLSPQENADSAYGGSAEKMNHTYAEIGNGGNSVTSEKPFFNSPPSINKPFFSSAPMINRRLFDADLLPVNIHNYATDV